MVVPNLDRKKVLAYLHGLQKREQLKDQSYSQPRIDLLREIQAEITLTDHLEVSVTPHDLMQVKT